jgi:hypothetical protein
VPLRILPIIVASAAPLLVACSSSPDDLEQAEGYLGSETYLLVAALFQLGAVSRARRPGSS